MCLLVGERFGALLAFLHDYRVAAFWGARAARMFFSAACRKASVLLEITATAPGRYKRGDPFVSTLRHPERKRGTSTHVRRSHKLACTFMVHSRGLSPRKYSEFEM